MNNQEQVINDLINELGFNNLPAEQLAELKSSITQRIEQKLFLDVMSKLSEEQQKQVSVMLEKGVDMVEVLNYISGVMPDFVKVLQDSLNTTKEEIKHDMKRIDQGIQEQTK